MGGVARNGADERRRAPENSAFSWPARGAARSADGREAEEKREKRGEESEGCDRLVAECRPLHHFAIVGTFGSCQVEDRSFLDICDIPVSNDADDDEARGAEVAKHSRICIMAEWYADIALEDLKSGIADGSIILIDVREADEFAQGHIEGALFNPLSRFDPAQIPVPGAGQKVVIYCRSGRRSVSAMEQARLFGRRDVSTHFGGGILGWQKAGEKVTTGA